MQAKPTGGKKVFPVIPREITAVTEKRPKEKERKKLKRILCLISRLFKTCCSMYTDLLWKVQEMSTHAFLSALGHFRRFTVCLAQTRNEKILWPSPEQ